MDSNKKIAVNSVIIFVRLCIVTLVSVIASRLVLDALGASDFGLYNVVGGLVSVLNIINASMMTTTYRFVAFELGKGESGQTREVFNASFILHAAFALFIFIVGGLVGEWYINNVMVLPLESYDNALFVFRVSLITTCISTLIVPHQGLLVAYEKFTYTAIVDVLSQIIKIILIFFLLHRSGYGIRTYSVIMLVFTFFNGALFFGYNLLKYKDIISFKIVKQYRVYREMLSFALWTLFGGVANIGKVQGSAMIVNYFWGTLVNAAYAVGNQVSSFVNTFASSLSSAAIPQITKNYSSGNVNRSVSLTSYISKYTYILMLLVAFPVILDIDFILSIWLKEVPEGSSVFCNLIVLDGLLGCIGAGIPSLVNAIGNIRFYQIIIYTFTIMGLPISFFAYKLGLPACSISAVFCVVTFVACLLKVILLSKYYHVDVKPLFKISYTKMAVMTIPLLLFYLFYDPSGFSLSWHLVGLACSEVFLIIVILTLGLEKKERLLVKNEVIKVINRVKIISK